MSGHQQLTGPGGPSPEPHVPCSLHKDLPPLLVIKEAKTVTGAKGDKPPLRVQSQRGDHSRRLALHQYKGLKARLEAHGPWAGSEALMPLPSIALLVLQQVSLRLLYHVL